MPVLQINLWEGRTHEEKAEVVKAITDDLVRILKCKPEAVTIMFSDYKHENWAKAGVLISDQPK
jgi:4-oxalocrotonate tautomerase